MVGLTQAPKARGGHDGGRGGPWLLGAVASVSPEGAGTPGNVYVRADAGSKPREQDRPHRQPQVLFEEEEQAGAGQTCVQATLNTRDPRSRPFSSPHGS